MESIFFCRSPFRIESFRIAIRYCPIPSPLMIYVSPSCCSCHPRCTLMRHSSFTLHCSRFGWIISLLKPSISMWGGQNNRILPRRTGTNRELPGNFDAQRRTESLLGKSFPSLQPKRISINDHPLLLNIYCIDYFLILTL